MTIEQALTRVYEEKNGEHSPASGGTALEAINVLLDTIYQSRVNDLGEGLYTMLTNSTGAVNAVINGTLDTIIDDIEAGLSEAGMSWDTFATALSPGGGLSAYIEIDPDETAMDAGAEQFWTPFWAVTSESVGFTVSDTMQGQARIVSLRLYSPDHSEYRIICGFYDTDSSTWVPFDELFSHVSYNLYVTSVL